MLRRQPCCVDRRFRRTVVMFLLISHKRQGWSLNWIHRQKPMNQAFQRYVCRTEMLSSFRIRIGNISRWPHLIQQCLGPPHAPLQTAARTVEALSRTYAVKSPLVTMARPKFAPKSTPSRGPIPKPQYLHYPWTRPTYNAKRHPDPIRRFSRCTGQTNRPTDGPTDRSRESLTTIGRCAQRAMRPNNNNQTCIAL